MSTTTTETTGTPAVTTAPKKGLRKMTWAILAWTALMTVSFILGAKSASEVPLDSNCVYYNGEDACRTASAAGAGIGLGIVFAVWFTGFIILSIIWAMTRPKDTVQVVVQPTPTTFTAEDVQAQIDAALAKHRGEVT